MNKKWLTNLNQYQTCDIFISCQDQVKSPNCHNREAYINDQTSRHTIDCNTDCMQEQPTEDDTVSMKDCQTCRTNWAADSHSMVVLTCLLIFLTNLTLERNILDSVLCTFFDVCSVNQAIGTHLTAKRTESHWRGDLTGDGSLGMCPDSLTRHISSNKSDRASVRPSALGSTQSTSCQPQETSTTVRTSHNEWS